MKKFYLFLAVTLGLCLASMVFATTAPQPVQIKDASGKRHEFLRPPQRVACLAPYVTQILVDLGQSGRIAALTRQDLVFHAALRKTSLGSYFTPDLAAIERCGADLVICPPGRAEQVKAALGDRIPILVMAATSMDQAFGQVRQMGRLFGCEKKAGQVLAEIRTQLSMVSGRLAREKDLEKKRTVRVMGGKTLSCPGDDSFQNEMIRAAGGIVPQWGKSGSAVEVDPGAWQAFNPQVIYGCNANADRVRHLLSAPPYNTVDAVKNGRIHMFPCEMTCRATTITGDFIQWLAAAVYPDIFADPKRAVTADRPLSWRPLAVDLDYVDRARVVEHRLADTPYKSLVLRFKAPMTLLSTFEGLRENQEGCGNTFIPMAASLGHMKTGVDRVKETLENNLGFSKGGFTTLMTGADMDHLALAEKTYKDLSVTALVTAGVRGNAMRLSKDKGYYFSHGTINIIVGTNRKLSTAAMSRALITATEAKTAALTDLDIRSRYTPWSNPATGTGTDNILVIQGRGPWVKYAGGHSKIAQLMAEAVHEGVTRAIAGQNGILKGRDIFQRLAERGMSLEALVRCFETRMPGRALTRELETLLGRPYYAAFVESALAVSDARARDLVRESPFWEETCKAVTLKICGRATAPAPCTSHKIPAPLAKALGAMIAGIESVKEIRQ
ncbi:MAG: adenosylcobinamide amidohydrolase [Desulfobacter sp.]|nr:MAG: adenosylcobinamide amidohydrolase [Desulfobacter sp.]